MKRRATGPNHNNPGGMSDTDAGNQQAADATADSENTRSRVQRRRNALKTISGGSVLAAGGLLPDQWARPVIQSVLLPAHAQTSPVPIDVTTTPIPSTTPDTPDTPASCEGCEGLTILNASAVDPGTNVATVSADGTIGSSDNCLDGQNVQVLLESYTGNNCDATGGNVLTGASSFFVPISGGGAWSFSGEEVGTGGRQNLQSVFITVAFPLVESPDCSDSVCVDASESGTGN